MSFVNARAKAARIFALVWLGRDDCTTADWPALRAEAARAHNRHTAEYLLGTPLLPDFQEAGLSALGYELEDLE